MATAPTQEHPDRAAGLLLPLHVGQRALIAAIRLYQSVTAGRAPACRFLPSCSDYALEAIERFGALRGSALAARRLAKCHPLGSFGLDPVPGAGRWSRS
jgi:putative membrane protein insertion efficiency factor